MRKPKSIIVVIALSSVSATIGATGSDWVYAGTNEDGKWFVDRGSLQRKGDIVTFWEWAQMHNGTSNLAHYRINCVTKVFKAYDIDGRDTGGRVVYRGASAPEDSIPDGSVIDHAYRLVC